MTDIQRLSLSCHSPFLLRLYNQAIYRIFSNKNYLILIFFIELWAHYCLHLLKIPTAICKCTIQRCVINLALSNIVINTMIRHKRWSNGGATNFRIEMPRKGTDTRGSELASWAWEHEQLSIVDLPNGNDVFLSFTVLTARPYSHLNTRMS